MDRGVFSSHPRYHLPKKRNNDSSQNPTLQTPSSPKHPGTDTGEDPHHQSRANVRLSMLIKPSFHQRNQSTTHNCAPCSAPSATKPARRSVPRADVATGWAEGNRSLTPVRAPSHRSVHHPPPWRRVAHLPSDSLKSHCFFFPSDSRREVVVYPPSLFTCIKFFN